MKICILLCCLAWSASVIGAAWLHYFRRRKAGGAPVLARPFEMIRRSGRLYYLRVLGVLGWSSAVLARYFSRGRNRRTYRRTISLMVFHGVLK